MPMARHFSKNSFCVQKSDKAIARFGYTLDMHGV